MSTAVPCTPSQLSHSHWGLQLCMAVDNYHYLSLCKHRDMKDLRARSGCMDEERSPGLLSELHPRNTHVAEEQGEGNRNRVQVLFNSSFSPGWGVPRTAAVLLLSHLLYLYFCMELTSAPRLTLHQGCREGMRRSLSTWIFSAKTNR